MMKKTPWLCVISILLCAGLLFGCGKNDEEDSSGRSNRSKETDATSEVTTTASETSSEVTSESTTAAPEVTTTEETLQETSQNTEILTEPTRSLSDEEAEMSRLRDEEEEDDGEEYEEPDEDGTGNGNNNGGNDGTTTTQPTETAAPTPIPIQTAPDGHWETRVIAEAWDETVVDQEAWDEEVKTAIGTQWTQNDTGTDMTGWSNSQIDTWCDSHNCPNHCDEYDPSQPGYCANNCTGKTIYETKIIHHDVVTHVVHHDAVTEQVWVED